MVVGGFISTNEVGLQVVSSWTCESISFGMSSYCYLDFITFQVLSLGWQVNNTLSIGIRVPSHYYLCLISCGIRVKVIQGIDALYATTTLYATTMNFSNNHLFGKSQLLHTYFFSFLFYYFFTRLFIYNC